MLDLNDVRNFVIVARKGTLRGAAEELHVPTSTIARSITRLETHLNVSLLKRSARGVLLTDHGTEFLHASKQALRTLRAGSERLQEQRDNPSGVIRVASPAVVANTILLYVLPEFLKKYPNLRVELQTYTGETEHDPKEDVDVCFETMPPKDSSRRMRKFPATLKGLCASREYVERAGIPTSPSELPKHHCIGAGTWTLFWGAQVATVTPRFRVETSDPSMMCEMVLADLGIAILPLYMVRQPEFADRLVQVLPAWHPAPTVHSALYFGPASLAPKIKCFLDFVAEFFGTNRDPRVGRAPFEGLFGGLES